MKLDRDLTGIYLTGLLFMMGNMLPNPIIAGYSVDLGATAVMMSVITGLNSIVAMICRPFVGNLADSINRYHLAMFGLITMFVGAILQTFALAPWMLAIGRVVNGVGFTCSSVCIPAWLATLLPREHVGRGIGLYGTIAALAMAIGPGTGVILYQTFGYRVAYGTIMAMQGLAIIFIQMVKKNRIINKAERYEKALPVKPAEPAERSGGTAKRIFSRLVYPKAVPVCSIALLLCIPYFSTQTYLVQFTEIKGFAIAIGLFFPVYAIILAVVRTSISGFVDRMPFKVFFWIGVGSMTIFMLMLNHMTSNLIMFVTGFFLATGYGMINTVCQSESVIIAGPGNEGIANGTFYLGLDVGVTIGTMMGGLVFTHVPTDWFFPCQLIVVPICILIYFTFIRPQERARHVQTDQSKTN